MRVSRVRMEAHPRTEASRDRLMLCTRSLCARVGTRTMEN
jgi:hypothetical protein